MAGLKLSYRDYSEEPCSVSINGADLTAANFDAQVALQDTLVAEIEGVILGTNYRLERVAQVTRASQTPPASEHAQRERKWRVLYEDTSSYKRYTIDLPMADATKLATNSDDANMSDADITAFVSAFEAYALSPEGGAVNVLKITHVGRRN